MDRLKIKGLGSLTLVGEKPVAGKDYLISILTSLESIEKDIKDEERPEYTYKMAYISTELVQEVGSSRKLKVENGKTPSQKLRYTLESIAVNRGLDKDEFYQSEMNKIMSGYLAELEK